MCNATLFAYIATIAQRAGLYPIEYQEIGQKDINVARSQTTDGSDLCTAMVLVARGCSNKLFENKPDRRMFAVLAGRLLYKHRYGVKPSIEEVDEECQIYLYYLMVPTSVRRQAHRWVGNMLINPIVVG